MSRTLATRLALVTAVATLPGCDLMALTDYLCLSRVLEIADLASLEIEADVLTADAVHIEPGDHVSIVRWGGDKALRGSVHRVEPSAFSRLSALGVEEQRVIVNIHIDSPREEWATLGDGYRVEVEIAIWEGDDVLTVPASSVFRHEGKWALYRDEGGVARLTPIEVDTGEFLKSGGSVFCMKLHHGPIEDEPV